MVDIMPENLPALSPVILFSQPSCTSNKISKNQWAYLVQRLSPCFEAPQKENLTRYFTMLLRSGGHCSLWCSLLPQQWPSRAFPHTNWRVLHILGLSFSPHHTYSHPSQAHVCMVSGGFKPQGHWAKISASPMPSKPWIVYSSHPNSPYSFTVNSHWKGTRSYFLSM